MMLKFKRKRETTEMDITIPKQFQKAVNEHLVGNILNLPDYPVILSIFGEPGIGKTYQLRKMLDNINFCIHSINAADLESDHAGEPTKLLRKEYVAASAELTSGLGAAIVIDDIDTTLGEWESYTGTVNHQDLIAFFMHIADAPTSMENISSSLRRVPIFFTGNDFSKLYGPLRRPGRMNLYEYKPSVKEKTEVVASILGKEYLSIIADFIDSHPDVPIAFYANMKANALAAKYSETIEDIDYKELVCNESYRARLREILNKSYSLINWEEVLASAISSLKQGETGNV